MIPLNMYMYNMIHVDTRNSANMNICNILEYLQIEFSLFGIHRCMNADLVMHIVDNYRSSYQAQSHVKIQVDLDLPEVNLNKQ